MIRSPFHFSPYYKSVIWGGDGIASLKGIEINQKNIGESWEISSLPGHESVVDRGPLKGKRLSKLIDMYGADLVGEDIYERFGNDFPLLIKFIDAKDDLSVQVHPDDDMARERHNTNGKTEMWHIIKTWPGAKIYTGLTSNLDRQEYEQRVADNSIMDVVATYDSAPGQTYFLPPGRIHSIGHGNLLAEIQQSCDITYRIYDFDRRDKDGNPRELHTHLAKDAIDFTVSKDYMSHPDGNVLADCKYFDVRRVKVENTTEKIDNPRKSFTIVMCLEGKADIIDNANGERFAIMQGDTLLFPAVMDSLSACGNANLLTVQS